MANSLDRLDGHAYAPSHELAGTPWAEFLSQIDSFFILFCTFGLLYVVMSQYARHRRRQKNLEKMRAHWQQERSMRQADVGANPKLRYDAGFWGDGS